MEDEWYSEYACQWADACNYPEEACIAYLWDRRRNFIGEPEDEFQQQKYACQVAEESKMAFLWNFRGVDGSYQL